MSREKLSSRMGFILLSAGCAIGLGNIWRFPFITGMYGGALFVLIYLVCLIILGIPIMTMEFAVGRSAALSAAKAFHTLEKPGAKWHNFSYAAMFGNYLLMFFYTTVSGWMLAYLVKIAKGDLAGLSPDQVGGAFGAHISNPGVLTMWMIIVCLLGFGICAAGLVNGVERIGKVMMLGLFVIVGILAIRSITLPGAGEGVAFLLKPSMDGIKQHGFGRVVYAAMGQAFFTLSLGIGSMTIFGSYINKERGLFGEAITVTLLDTSAAIGAGLVIFPACFAYGVNPGAGPGLIFVTLPNIFNNMPLGQLWGTLFFVFMVFAAMSTVIAVFENLIAFLMELTGMSRIKACVINFFIVVIFSLPCALSFSVLSGFTLMGGVLDVEDFILSNNLLPLGALVYCLFCTSKMGWGFDNFLTETNTGAGMAFPKALKPYVSYVIPVIIVIIFIVGYIDIFGK
jgi:NSS family neurotransmitter:Na+ symporter